MRKLVDMLREIAGLFIDDGSLAVALLLWLGAFAMISTETGLHDILKAGILFGGCAVILLENVCRRARKL
jgi:hypothetical protein